MAEQKHLQTISGKIGAISSKGLIAIKNAENPYFSSKYADLASVQTVLNPAIAALSLYYRFKIGELKDGVAQTITKGKDDAAQTVVNSTLQSEVILVVGDENSEEEIMRFPVLNITDAQKAGSGITYAKRYLLITAFNILAELDDDGNAAAGNKTVAAPTFTKADAPKPSSVLVDGLPAGKIVRKRTTKSDVEHAEIDSPAAPVDPEVGDEIPDEKQMAKNTAKQALPLGSKPAVVAASDDAEDDAVKAVSAFFD